MSFFLQAACFWWIAGLVMALALLLDRLGEPPAQLHPVVWMGAALGWLGARVAPAANAPAAPAPLRQFAAGTLAWCLLAVLVVALAALVQAVVTQWPWPVGTIALVLLLKPLLAWRMLRDETAAAETALAQSLEAGRTQLARLVSRDVHALDATQVREAALSTLAENLNDSVVAPLFWFAMLGLPGAALYRLANTADAMWGYRGQHHGQVWEWAGKWAARADDVLSWLPARLTAALLGVLARAQGAVFAWRQLRDEARHTPSPNSGWPMAALALALGVQLGKQGVYTLHASGRLPQATDMHTAHRLCGRAAWLGALLLAVLAAAAAPLWCRILP